MENINTLLYSMRAQGTEVILLISDELLNAAEERYGITFPKCLRDFYKWGMPIGENYPNWISEDEEEIARNKRMLEFPMNSMRSAVEDMNYWSGSWGERPADDDDALELALDELELLMKKNPPIPVMGHNYLISGENLEGDYKDYPVLSIFGDDIIFQADSFLSFFQRRFMLTELPEITEDMVEKAGAWKELVS